LTTPFFSLKSRIRILKEDLNAMKRYSLILSAFTLFFTLSGCTPKGKYTQPEWKVGDWVEYDVQSAELGPRTIRYAITGVDTLKGEPYYWLEMIVTIPDGRVVNKMFIPYGYHGVAERMIFKVGEQPPIEMPPGSELAWYPADENRPFVFTPDEIKNGKMDDSTVVVPAGEFRCIYSKVYDVRYNKIGKIEGDSVVDRVVTDSIEVEVFACDSIAVLGIAALKSAREEMKLKAQGHDATTAITEKVTPLDSIVFK